MRSLWFVLAPALVACSLDEPDTRASGQLSEVHNRLASNRLASNRLASNRLASNRLASNSISATVLLTNAETAQLLETKSGRDVYSYLISCALPADQTMVADLSALPPPADPMLGCGEDEPCRPTDTNCEDPGPLGENCPNYTCVNGECTFDGNLGLAPRWASKKLNTAEKGWISACLFSRVNANDVAEAISIRGTTALAVGTSEAEQFVLEEGAFYGNLFTDAPEGADPDWNACSGRDKDANPTAGGLANRLCAEEDPNNLGFTYCGFKYAGPCRDYDTTVATPYACKKASTVTVGVTAYTQYDDCHDQAANGRWPGSANRSAEVLTVFVSNL